MNLQQYNFSENNFEQCIKCTVCYRVFGYSGFFRYVLTFVVLHHIALFLIESLTLFDPLFLAIRIVSSVLLTTLLVCTAEAFNLIDIQKIGE